MRCSRWAAGAFWSIAPRPRAGLFPRYEDDLKKWMDRLLVDLKKRIDTNTERLQAAEKPLFLVEDQVSDSWVASLPSNDLSESWVVSGAWVVAEVLVGGGLAGPGVAASRRAGSEWRWGRWDGVGLRSSVACLGCMAGVATVRGGCFVVGMSVAHGTGWA